ncbi:MAG TPA: hypothetical protein VLF66_01925 [Thermoanaerobaculia bacterium]|nr:hypothetical protein [Thermoanaerobaculia bacterium]
MSDLRRQIRITMGLGALAVLAGVVAHLALTDIYHGEGDLALEWRALQACSVTVAGFVGAALLTLGRALRRLSGDAGSR